MQSSERSQEQEGVRENQNLQAESPLQPSSNTSSQQGKGPLEPLPETLATGGYKAPGAWGDGQLISGPPATEHGRVSESLTIWGARRG